MERGALAVLVPDPKVVRRLLTRYASLKIAYAEKETLETARALEDVTYTLCVMTGTNRVHDAVAAADALLVAAGGQRGPADDEGREQHPFPVARVRPPVEAVAAHGRPATVPGGRGGAVPGTLV
ncbi:DUF5133 domain-containing protein [Streptomyces siamensis]|uniref:DUF5133 domain-containing protein n=1 Tax=Streptomyces siamensis TaxID=1274986 RepID=A0ABP9IQA6_9ACTN